MSSIEVEVPATARFLKTPTLSAPELSRFYVDSSVLKDDMVASTKQPPPLVESSSCMSSDDDYVLSDDNDSIEGKNGPEATDQPLVTGSLSFVPERVPRKLHWKFTGLTLWLELEEFNSDITNAIRDFSRRHNSPLIPKSHTTAIYGMTHLSIDEAKNRLRTVRNTIPRWPPFEAPTGIVSDVSENGRPGQVCTIAWSELTLATNSKHEAALDELYRIFAMDESTEQQRRNRPWKPHNSIAYDNPEDNTLSLSDTVQYISKHPTLLSEKRRVDAISLWNTEGTMDKWECIDRVKFY